MKEPKNLVEMEEAIALYDRLVEEVEEKEKIFPSITDEMLVLEKYNVFVSNEIRSQERAIPTEWGRYLEVLQEAEKMLGYSKVLVKGQKAKS